ncbi:hypothetical protein JCM11641_001787 [Rhodosporidiobolus odoratus]
MTIPQHVVDLIVPLCPPNTTFSLRNDRISSSTSSQQYLHKTATGADATQLVGEAECLRRMSEACAAVCPKLIGSGEEEGGEKWMLCEWHTLVSIQPSEQPRLAEYLAQMHLAPPPSGQKYGFPVPTCCGVTKQDNTEEESWSTFFGKRRIGDMLDRIGDPELGQLGKKLQERVVPKLLDGLDIKPSILHGDLWAGNARYSRDRSAPITFDPSSYYGHSEADLGITHMFGGFSPDFYERYHELVPKTAPVEEYEQRQQLYELYHHLNHTLMFGGSYKGGAIRLMRGLLQWADEESVQIAVVAQPPRSTSSSTDG